MGKDGQLVWGSRGNNHATLRVGVASFYSTSLTRRKGKLRQPGQKAEPGGAGNSEASQVSGQQSSNTLPSSVLEHSILALPRCFMN